MVSVPLSEYSIETAVLEWLALSGLGFFWKNTSGGFHDGKRWRKHESPFAIRGTSDILGIINGRMVAFEVKAERGVASSEQKAFIKKVRECGGIADVVRSVDQVKEVLRSHGLIA